MEWMNHNLHIMWTQEETNRKITRTETDGGIGDRKLYGRPSFMARQDI